MIKEKVLKCYSLDWGTKAGLLWEEWLHQWGLLMFSNIFLLCRLCIEYKSCWNLMWLMWWCAWVCLGKNCQKWPLFIFLEASSSATVWPAEFWKEDAMKGTFHSYASCPLLLFYAEFPFPFGWLQRKKGNKWKQKECIGTKGMQYDMHMHAYTNPSAYTTNNMTMTTTTVCKPTIGYTDNE